MSSDVYASLQSLNHITFACMGSMTISIVDLHRVAGSEEPSPRAQFTIQGFVDFFACSAFAMVSRTAMAVSGVTEMLEIPQSIRNGGNSSGKSEGACPQIPISKFLCLNFVTMSRIIDLTAGERASTGFW